MLTAMSLSVRLLGSDCVSAMRMFRTVSEAAGPCWTKPAGIALRVSCTVMARRPSGLPRAIAKSEARKKPWATMSQDAVRREKDLARGPAAQLAPQPMFYTNTDGAQLLTWSAEVCRAQD